MESQIYLPDVTRRYHQKQIDGFVSAYFERLLPTFGAIADEADEAAEKHWNAVMKQPADDDSVDASEVAESATERGVETYELLSLGKYTLTAAWHVTLYELFEQQLRLFLFEELSHHYIIAFEKFCTSMNELKDCLKDHSFDPEKEVSSWSVIEELQLLCNVVKHSDGNSARKLKALNPRMFRSIDGTNLLDLYRTTLLEISLNIDDVSLRRYVSALHTFWDEMPERNYAINS